jgi:hypothetical protein
VLEQLSEKLAHRYGTGFPIANLQNFRQFYLIYPDLLDGIRYPSGSEFEESSKPSRAGKEIALTKIGYPTGSEFPQCFSPLLSWSHYRALMRVQDDRARRFYEQEAIECGWSKSQLERQIHSSYYQRIIANRGKTGLLPATRERLQGEAVPAEHILKSPYVLEFLGLPGARELHESALEQAKIKVPGDNPTIGLILCSDKGEAVANVSAERRPTDFRLEISAIPAQRARVDRGN